MNEPTPLLHPLAEASAPSLASEFERHRGYLRALAYRMLGSMAEADDAVQECWLRLDRGSPDMRDDLRPWLSTVVARICLDMLRSRRSRREEYAGSWLPEPAVVDDMPPTPEEESTRADAVGLALLVVLETLSPAERLAFVLHDVFGMPFEEIAPVVGRSPVATRQLASRGRRRVQSSARDADEDRAVQRHVIEAFLAAAREGDFDGLLAVLDPQVVMRFDGGGRGPLARPTVHGARLVAEASVTDGRRYMPFCRIATVNGEVGAVVVRGDRPIAVIGFGFRRGRIREIDLVGDPAKLARVEWRHSDGTS